MRCARCGRVLKNIPKPHRKLLYGPVCLRKVKKAEKDKEYPNLGEFW